MVHYKKASKREIFFWFVGIIICSIAGVYISRYKLKTEFTKELVDLGYRHFNSDKRCQDLFVQSEPKEGLYVFFADWSPGSELAKDSMLEAAVRLKEEGRRKSSFFVDLSLYKQGRAEVCARLMEVTSGNVALPSVIFYKDGRWSRLEDEPSEWSAEDIVQFGQ